MLADHTILDSTKIEHQHANFGLPAQMGSPAELPTGFPGHVYVTRVSLMAHTLSLLLLQNVLYEY